ncbi:MAG: type II toxin-antitoxin system HicA family toxin [Burkholderiaceae bacterium]|nr:type II toxin-antitoxin system HicA family toxin [Burkholderiaceae bacterium]
MNSKHRKTLALLFAQPTPRTLAWADIEALLLALGARRANRGGSAVGFELHGLRLDIHRPHPQKEAKPYLVKNAAQFLKLAGVKL